MKSSTYLMSFECMLQLLRKRNVDNYSNRMNLHNFDPFHLCQDQSVELSDDRAEKFLGTWWKVEIPNSKAGFPQCRYLADSLQDALRLEPAINLSYWVNEKENISQFLADIQDWIEDECVLA